MKFNPDIHHRRSIRLKDYDYAQAGAYFVTICTQGRECLFGEIKNGEVELSLAGRMIQTVWGKLPGRYPDIELDEFIIMPNHIHGILVIVGAPLVGARGGGMDGRKNAAETKNRVGTRPTPTNDQKQNTTAMNPAPILGEIVGVFKSVATHEYVKGTTQQNWPPFPGRLWQRNYYEHIIRDEKSLNKIRDYIIHNPLRWEFDRDNIAGKPDGIEEKFWKVFGQNRK